MNVLRVVTNTGALMYGEDTSSGSVERASKAVPDWASISIISMTQAEYAALPAAVKM